MPYVLAPYEYVEKNIWWLVLVRIARLNIVGQEYIKIRDFLKFFILLVYSRQKVSQVAPVYIIAVYLSNVAFHICSSLTRMFSST